MSRCTTPGCKKPILYRAAGLCAACYSAQVYWARKTPSQRAKRRKSLEIFDARLMEFIHLRRVV